MVLGGGSDEWIVEVLAVSPPLSPSKRWTGVAGGSSREGTQQLHPGLAPCWGSGEGQACSLTCCPASVIGHGAVNQLDLSPYPLRWEWGSSGSKILDPGVPLPPQDHRLLDSAGLATPLRLLSESELGCGCRRHLGERSHSRLWEPRRGEGV